MGTWRSHYSADYRSRMLQAAAASRDIGTAQEFIKGMAPEHSGGDGTGDDHFELIKVPLKAPGGWDTSLTVLVCS